MYIKSPKTSVHKGHERPSHACGSGPALPAVSPRRQPILRDRRGHADECVITRSKGSPISAGFLRPSVV